MEEARAILLRKHRYSENSLVVVWLTDRHGKVKTAVRGATRPGSPFSGRLELFTEADIAFKPPKSGDLHSLSEASPVDVPIPADYSTLLAAAYFSELCDLFTETQHPVPEVFSLLRRAWGFLRSREPDIRAVEHFEVELARALGVHDPSLPAHRSLASVSHRLPANRALLLRRLSQE